MKIFALTLAGLLVAMPALAAPGNATGNASWQGSQASGFGLSKANAARHSAPLPLAGGLPAALLIAGTLVVVHLTRRGTGE